MAMLGGLLAYGNAEGAGKHQAYLESLAQQDEQRKFIEQQREFDAQQASRDAASAEAQRQFDAQQKLAQNADSRAQAETDHNNWLWRPPSATDKYGGSEYQKAAMAPRLLAQQVRSGDLTIAGQQLGNEGTALTNAGRAFANHIAPMLTQLDILGKQTDITNAQQSDPRLVQQRQMQRDTYLNSLNQQTYAWQRQYDITLQQRFGTIDPAKVTKDYTDALKGVDSGRKSLDAVDKAGKSLIPPAVKDAIAFAESQITGAQDPMSKASELIASGNPAAASIRSAGFTGHLYQVALAEYLRRKMQGQSGPPAQPPPGINPNATMFGPERYGGSTTPFPQYGRGSNAAPPFPGS